MDGKGILDVTKLVKEQVQCFLKWGTSGQPQQNHIWIRGGELKNERKPWNSKLIGKFLLTVTVADPEWFILKGKPITYTGTLVELYNWRNYRQVYEIYEIVELEKMRASITKNPRNLGACQIIEIFLILHNAHVVFRN